MSFSLSGGFGGGGGLGGALRGGATGGLVGGLFAGGGGAAQGGLLGGLLGAGFQNPFAMPGAPQSPDYIGAAREQGTQNRETAQFNAKLNNPNVNGPLGSQNVTWNNGVATVNQSLSPEQQALYGQQTGNQQQIGQNLQGNLGGFNQAIQAPLGQDAGGYQQQATNAIMSRMQPQLQWQKQALDTQLQNQGITPGSEAYNRAQILFGQQANDASQQAVLAGYGLGQQQLQGDINLGNYAGQQQANMLGQSAATLPQFQGFQGSQAQAAPIMNATEQQGAFNTDLYNQQVAGANANRSGLFGLGGMLGAAGIMAPAASDIRVKENISYLGSVNGYNVYEFEYKPEFRNRWGHGKRIGVMAQEVEKVRPEAVFEYQGYKVVDYGRL